MTKWAQAFRQTTTYLGVVVIAIIWSGIYLLSSKSMIALTRTPCAKAAILLVFWRNTLSE